MKFNQNPYIFIQENAFERIVCEMGAILFRPQFVNNDAYILSKLVIGIKDMGVPLAWMKMKM